ncbi:MAG: hypothetical protein MJA82_09850 [Clostridia bacterium]|nr:hypothetical protein [Clostridia bacterium]
MKTKIGVIGVYDSIEMIKKISIEFKNIAEFTFCVYDELDEISNFIENTRDTIEVLMVTGQYPYSFIKNNIDLCKPYFSISKSNETLIETLWRMRDENIDYTKVSIDRSPRNEILEILQLLKIPIENIYLSPDSSKTSLDEIYKFHFDLWKEGKTSASVTSNYKTYKRLSKDGVPVYRILTSRYLIRESIKKAIELAKTEKIKSMQVAVQTIRIKDINDTTYLKYNYLKLINRFDKILIDYTQENQGSFFKFGRNEYMIFTTRGFLSISTIEEKFGWLVEKIEKLKLSFSLGIGYGDTVTKAESNSKIALNHAIKESKNSCYIVEEDSTITGPIFGKNSYNLSYNLISVDPRITEVSKETGVSEKYLSKLKAIIKHSSNNTFDTEELAKYLDITPRSAGRIINKLEFAGVASIIGKKSEKKKGRPKKIYSIDLH